MSIRGVFSIIFFPFTTREVRVTKSRDLIQSSLHVFLIHSLPIFVEISYIFNRLLNICYVFALVLFQLLISFTGTLLSAQQAKNVYTNYNYSVGRLLQEKQSNKITQIFNGKPAIGKV